MNEEGDPVVASMEDLTPGAWRTTVISDPEPLADVAVVAAWQGTVTDTRGRISRLGTVAHLRRRDAETTEINISLLRGTEAGGWESLIESGIHVGSPTPLFDEIEPLRTEGGCGHLLTCSTQVLEEFIPGDFVGVFGITDASEGTVRLGDQIAHLPGTAESFARAPASPLPIGAGSGLVFCIGAVTTDAHLEFEVAKSWRRTIDLAPSPPR